MNHRQILGFRIQMQGFINKDRTGAEVTVPLTTAKAMVQIMDQLMRIERELEGEHKNDT